MQYSCQHLCIKVRPYALAPYTQYCCTPDRKQRHEAKIWRGKRDDGRGDAAIALPTTSTPLYIVFIVSIHSVSSCSDRTPLPNLP